MNMTKESSKDWPDKATVEQATHWVNRQAASYRSGSQDICSECFTGAEGRPESMDPEKKARLEAKGWKIGTASDFLGIFYDEQVEETEDDVEI